jgi:hypothetical protein
MTAPAPVSRLGSEFDAFLFALIGEDRNGMPLSVVSVLARRDLDPWHEAASLARLPAETAAGKLAALLRAIPDPALKQMNLGATAARLIALLPCWVDPNIRPPAAQIGAVSAVHPRMVMSAILLALYMILALGTLIGRRDPTVRADPVATPAPAAVPSQAPITTSGK